MAKNKVAAECQIKSVPHGLTENKVSFKDLSFTENQCRQLEHWLAEKRQVCVTITASEKLLTDESS